MSTAAANLPLIASVFSSNMVLQRGVAWQIWGWSEHPERVEVVLVDSATRVPLPVSVRGGKWTARGPVLPAGGPYNITVTEQSTGTHKVMSNVMMGDVFVCGGQSNMQMTVSMAFNSTSEIAAADHPMLRLFTAAQNQAREPLDDIVAQPLADGSVGWKVATPKTVGGPDWEYFAATCYYFGRDLLLSFNRTVAIGLLASNKGATMIETWLTDEACATCGVDVAVPPENEPMSPNTPTVHFNAQVSPLLDFSIRGVLWWQGENNADNATRYGCTFAEMIKAWQSAWRGPSLAQPLPFIFVLLEAYPSDYYEYMRDTQLWAMKLRGVSFSSAIDAGDLASPFGPIHPRDKQTVGRRAMLAARKLCYNDTDVVAQGPALQSVRVLSSFVVSGGASYQLRARFSADRNARGPLYLRDAPQCSECCQRSLPFAAGQGPQSTHSRANPSSVVWEDERTVLFNITYWQQPEWFFMMYDEYPQCVVYDATGLPATPARVQLNHLPPKQEEGSSKKSTTLPLIASVFSSNMVLQRGVAWQIWGWSEHPERVEVVLVDSATRVPLPVSVRGGKWTARGPVLPAGGPYNITVTELSTGTHKVMNNVMMGDVFVCGGQSNMQMTVSMAFNSTSEIAAADHPMLRLFTAAQNQAREPLDDIVAQPLADGSVGWKVATPKTVGGPNWQHFSATCYYFGRDLLLSFNRTVAIGLIASCVGGTIVESWMPAAALSACHIPLAMPPVGETVSPNTPTVFFNAMIHPLTGYSIRGVLWWQGEHNADNATRYACTFANMLRGWQAAWGGVAYSTPLPIIFVLLEAFPEDAYQYMREVQLRALSVPRVGFSSAIDTGDRAPPLRTCTHTRQADCRLPRQFSCSTLMLQRQRDCFKWTVPCFC